LFQGSAEINYDTLYCKADMALERKNSFITMYWAAEVDRRLLNRREDENKIIEFKKFRK
jgi:hypothetical protein